MKRRRSRKFDLPSIRILSTCEPDLPFGRAWIADDGDGRTQALALRGGVACEIETKESILGAGLAFCSPVDAARALDWPMIARVEVDGRARVLKCFTADPRTVAAARHYHALAVAGKDEPGMEL